MDCIVIDDDPAPASRRRKKPLPQDFVVDLVSSEEEERPTAKQRKRPAAAAAYTDEDEDFVLEDSPPPARKKPRQPRKAKEPVEKRVNEFGATVRYSAQPSQAVYQRIQRALPNSGHRMFLISTKERAPAGAAGGRAQEFDVLGATGNVYTVTIKKQPHCTCPDHDRGNLCKHVLFVYLRVLKMSTTNPLVWQKALLTNEVEEILSGSHSQGVDAGVVAEDSILRAYRAAKGEEAGGDGGAGGSGKVVRKPAAGDCPICFNEMEEDTEPLVWCQTKCGNNLHKDCFNKWAAAKRSSGQQVTCVYCRAAWAGAGGGGGGAGGGGGGEYLNLAEHTHQYDRGTSLEELYGETAMWIQHHATGGGGRGNAARMWRARH